MTHTEQYMREVAEINRALDWDAVERMANTLDRLRYAKGRLFLIGLGGSAANCAHAASDFRTLCEIDAYSLIDPTEFSARANDGGLSNVFRSMLKARDITDRDVLMVLSVGGGTVEVSKSIVLALPLAHTILGIVGPNGGMTFQKAANCIRIPAPETNVTPHTEAFQAVILHCLVSHPILQRNACKWP